MSIKTVISPTIANKLQKQINYFIVDGLFRKITKVEPALYINQLTSKDFTLKELQIDMLENRIFNFSIGKLILKTSAHEVHYYFDIESFLKKKLYISSDISLDEFHCFVEYSMILYPNIHNEIQVTLDHLFHIFHISNEDEMDELSMINVLISAPKLYYFLCRRLQKGVFKQIES